MWTPQGQVAHGEEELTPSTENGNVEVAVVEHTQCLESFGVG